jgi:bacterioferritin
MKGDKKVIEILNSLLGRELTVVSQYMVHAEICDNWGYTKLHDAIQKRAKVEMTHAEKLIGRIIFLEGIPVVSELEKMHIGKDIPLMFANDHQPEKDAEDFATREVLEHILDDEDGHVDSIEEVQDQIAQMGIQIFLSKQIS